MNRQTHYAVNQPRVIHETIDGEAIIMDLNQGFYFSLEGLGAEIWNLLVEGTAVDRVVGVISQRYAGDDETIRTGVQELITSLEAASLIVPADAPPSPTEPEPTATGDSAEKSLFVAPKLNTYSDMKNLLLLDPIHDAADGAWPNRD
jgi:hypothetical protein